MVAGCAVDICSAKMLSALVLSFSVIFAMFALIWWLKNKKRWNMFSHLPAFTPFSLVGNVQFLAFLNSESSGINPITMTAQIIEGMRPLYPKERMCLFWLGPKPLVFLYGAETIEPVLKSSALIEKGELYRLVKPWLGNGLLTSGGTKWRTARKLLTPTFHFRILEDFQTIMNEQSAVFVKKIKVESEKEKWLDVLHYTSLFTFDVICETAMGIRSGAQEDSNAPYISAVKEFIRIAASRLARPILLPNFIFSLTKSSTISRNSLKTMKDFTKSVILERASKKKQSNENVVSEERLSKKLAFLDMLLDLPKKDMDMESIREEVETFMFAGHDTTGASVSWILYLLGLHQDIQHKVFEEVDQIFKEDTDRDVTKEDLKQLKYLDRVIKEALRLYSPVPFIGRRLTADTQIGGYSIPKETDVFICIGMLHRDQAVFPSPEVFDPERFSPENCSGRHPYAYTPFSSGPRNCIGQKFADIEEKIFLCHVLRHFRVLSKDPRDKLIIVPAGVQKTEGPLYMRFCPR